MGGLASLYAGIRDRMMFERIFVSAPMVALDRQPFGMAGMARLAGTHRRLGLGRLAASAWRGDKAQLDRLAASPPTRPATRRR